MRVFIDAVEYSQITAAITALQPKRMLEWGSGGSTIDFLKRYASVEKLVSVEHHPLWFEKVKAAATDPRLSYFLCEGAEVEPAPEYFGLYRGKRAAWRNRAETDRSMFREYIDLPTTLGLTFDCIFVDGRARSFCMEVGWELLERGGLMIVHDAQRASYQATIARLGTPTYLSPWRSGQVCLLPKK
jgi:predicted O-methyltransferase YrrM